MTLPKPPLPATDRRSVLRAGAACALALPALHAPAQAPAAAPAVPTPTPTPAPWRNWSGLQSATPRRRATPGSEAEMAALLREHAAMPVRCVGAGHSFTPLVPTEGLLMSLDRMSGVSLLPAAPALAQVQAGTRLSVVSRQLDQAGKALRVLPDIDLQSLAGAIATGTHGTGAALPALHADVVGLRLVTARGDILECSEQQRPELLAAARVSLGCLGVVTQATVRVVDTFHLQRRVWIEPTEALLANAEQLARQHRNFEFYWLPFTGHCAAIAHDPTPSTDVLMPPAADEDVLRDLRRLRDLLGGMPALRRWVAGQILRRTPAEESRNRSWRLLSTHRPTRFNETEYHLPREAALPCLREVIAALESRNEVFFPLEFRFVAADDAWLSPFYQQPSCSIAVHAAADEPHAYLVDAIGAILRRHGGRPHWGKLHGLRAQQLAPLYPRWKDFLELRATLDPHGRFLNPHLREVFGVTTA